MRGRASPPSPPPHPALRASSRLHCHPELVSGSHPHCSPSYYWRRKPRAVCGFRRRSSDAHLHPSKLRSSALAFIAAGPICPPPDRYLLPPSLRGPIRNCLETRSWKGCSSTCRAALWHSASLRLASSGRRGGFSGWERAAPETVQATGGRSFGPQKGGISYRPPTLFVIK